MKNKNNLLKEKYPEIFAQIDVERTLQQYPDLDLENITVGSRKKLWWKCKEHNTLWQAEVYRRTNNKCNCPICMKNQKVKKLQLKNLIKGVNDLKTLYPEIAKEWNYEKNSNTPDNITVSSGKKYWFKCSRCGGDYLALISNKTQNNASCPYCSNKKVLPGYNDFQTRFPNIAKEWDYKKNYPVLPNQILPGTHKKYWFICKNGHSFHMSVNSRTSYHFCNCPYCAHQKSIPELTIYEICKEYIDINSLSGTKIDGWEIDVYIPSKNICVEYDGSHFHNSDEAKERENRKNSCILEDSKNYTMIRIKETTVKN